MAVAALFYKDPTLAISDIFLPSFRGHNTIDLRATVLKLHIFADRHWTAALFYEDSTQNKHLLKNRKTAMVNFCRVFFG